VNERRTVLLTWTEVILRRTVRPPRSYEVHKRSQSSLWCKIQASGESVAPKHSVSHRISTNPNKESVLDGCKRVKKYSQDEPKRSAGLTRNAHWRTSRNLQRQLECSSTFSIHSFPEIPPHLPRQVRSCLWRELTMNTYNMRTLEHFSFGSQIPYKSNEYLKF
jgi:hypothetical protein